MTKKQFTIIRIFVVICLSISIGLSVQFGYTFVPPLAIIIATALVLYMMHRVKEVMVDERDYRLGGQAARLTFNFTAVGLTALGGSLMAYSVNHPEYYRYGYLTLYLVCFMLVVNIFAFLYYQKKGSK